MVFESRRRPATRWRPAWRASPLRERRLNRSILRGRCDVLSDGLRTKRLARVRADSFYRIRRESAAVRQIYRSGVNFWGTVPRCDLTGVRKVAPCKVRCADPPWFRVFRQCMHDRDAIARHGTAGIADNLTVSRRVFGNGGRLCGNCGPPAHGNLPPGTMIALGILTNGLNILMRRQAVH